MAQINVGDLVRITDRGYHYAHWGDMYRTLEFDNDNDRDNPYDNGTILQVFAKTPHPYQADKILYGLEPQSGGAQILMGNGGIEYVFPTHWYIKVTAENKNMLGLWRTSGELSDTHGYICSSLEPGSPHRGWWFLDLMRVPNHCQIEISTEQFIQYVLTPNPNNMPQNLTPEQEYAACNIAMNLQPGDIVRVTHSVCDNYRGWNNHWNEDMNRFIGNEYQVDEVRSSTYGVRLIGTHYQFPIYSLELVRRANDVEPPTPTVTIPTNLENEAQDEVVVTTDRVICVTDKWNYINLGSVYEVTKRDEYYTYVKDEVGGESRYAHYYFEEWVHEELKAKREQFKNLFGDHSSQLYLNSGDDVKKLLAELYPKIYKYNDWMKLERNNTHTSWKPFAIDGISTEDLILINDASTSNQSLHGCLRFDHGVMEMNTFVYRGYTYVRFRHRN